ncbi:BrnT family toxin [Ghiorsea bivora]|uniref:BrnT family toxin n=1 Tax=Ghiorsea bivora TaxID=1485545 RepID=UPI00056E4E3A|nr:BrnT family toxin [Ghiorsea bivora]
MKPINWNPDKNRKLIEERGVSFEDIIFSLQSGCLLDDISHPNQEKYSHQRVFIVAIDDYAYLVPYIENDEEIFLKTVVPSRKATKQHLGGKT